jgi:hypothetical protein
VSLVDHVISATTFAEPPVPFKTCDFQTEKLSGKQIGIFSHVTSGCDEDTNQNCCQYQPFFLTG